MEQSSLLIMTNRIIDVIGEKGIYVNNIDCINKIKDTSVVIKIIIRKTSMIFVVYNKNIRKKYETSSSRIIMYKEQIIRDISQDIFEFIMDGLKNFSEIVDKLELDVINGNYYLLEDKDEINKMYDDIKNMSDIFNKFGDLKNIECSICFEITRTSPLCGHKLCLLCWNKIYDKKCPICRKKNLDFIDNHDYKIKYTKSLNEVTK
uniref:RING-type domain-containing protein n=1 Tax=viral metagenome TaxID=1070528 RepID=A0A6C0H654_9ZZZZ